MSENTDSADLAQAILALNERVEALAQSVKTVLEAHDKKISLILDELGYIHYDLDWLDNEVRGIET